MLFRSPTAVGIITGAVAGLVAITPASGTVGPMGAIVIGLASGIICYIASTSVKRTLGYDDSLDVFGVHGVGGIVGAILTGVFSAASLGGSGINTETIGSQGLYIHPNIWHEGVFPIQEKCSFQGRQGKVHARVSIDLQKEFKKYIFFKTSMN